MVFRSTTNTSPISRHSDSSSCASTVLAARPRLIISIPEDAQAQLSHELLSKVTGYVPYRLFRKFPCPFWHSPTLPTKCWFPLKPRSHSSSQFLNVCRIPHDGHPAGSHCFVAPLDRVLLQPDPAPASDPSGVLHCQLH
jgi:hypothetical protein